MTIALHACCGPCLIEPLRSFTTLDDVVVVYANPNIDPAEEYLHRRDALFAYADGVGVRVVELEYDPAAWQEAVSGVERDDAARCGACYRLRLGMTARWAVAHGAHALATTLTVSPYQDSDAIRTAGQEVASRSGVEYLDRDFRDRYPAAMARARELELYRQNYCGCSISRTQAEQERARRRATRRQAGSETGRRGLRVGDS